MYCVTCDADGVLMHADTIYGGDALCSDHARERRRLTVDGTNRKQDQVEQALVPAGIS